GVRGQESAGEKRGTGGSLRSRLAEAVDQALDLGEGNLVVAFEPDAAPQPSQAKALTADSRLSTPDSLLSAHYACTHCDISYSPPSPQMFSFNSPQGMCADCDGLGTRYTFDADLLIPEPAQSLWDGTIPLVGAVRSMGKWRRHIYHGIAEALNFDL